MFDQYLISCLLQNPSGVIDAEVEIEDFEDGLSGFVFSEMKRLWIEKQSFGLSDFSKSLASEDFEALREILDLSVVCTTAQIRDYALAIREAAEKRRIMAAVMGITPNMSLAEMRERLSSIGRAEAKQDRARTGEQVLAEIKQSLELPPACDKTYLHALDTAMGGGLYQSFVYGFCGAEKSGKTTLAHTISYNLDKGGTKHGYFALEMGSMYIEQRNISRDMGINSLSFLNKRKEIAAKIDAIKPRKNTIYVDAAGFTLDEIISEASRMIVRHGIKGFFLDYWQLVSGENSRMTEEKHLRDVAQKLADFAKRQKIWIIILAQMNQDGRLFGGGGLKKACEQLYMIRPVEGAEDMRWLEMDASRYTLRVNVGSDAVPSLRMVTNIGPYFEEI